VLVCAAAVWAAAAPAHAQVIRTRPFPGLFGSGDPEKSVTQVDFLSFLSGGHETSTSSLADGALGSSTTDNTFGNLVFRGRMAHQGRRSVFSTDGRATTSYYDRRGGMSPFNFSGGARFTTAVGRHGTLGLRQTAFYSPFYVFSAVEAEPEAEIDPAPAADDDSDSVDPRLDQRAARLSTKGYTTNGAYSFGVGRSGTFFSSYRFSYIDSAPGVFDLMANAPNVGYRPRVSRFGRLTASYGFRSYKYVNSPYDQLLSHDIVFGYGYDRPLSAWRRTTAGFNVSTAVVDGGGFTRAHLNATARLHRRFGRTWVLGLNYARGQQVLDGFTAPFFAFSDAVRGSFTGRVVRDITWSGRLTYSHSHYTLDALESSFDTTSASTRVQVPVMWALALYVEGFYNQHDFQRRLGLLEGIPTSLERTGVRAGLTVNVPVYR
jgi:hypothetical protein